MPIGASAATTRATATCARAPCSHAARPRQWRAAATLTPPSPNERAPSMLRLTDLKLPLDHDEAALAKAIRTRLKLGPDDLRGYTVAKRSHDARKRGAIVLIYALDIEVADEAARAGALCRRSPRRPDAGHPLPLRCLGAADSAASAGGHRHRPVRPVRRADPGADGFPPDHPRPRQGRARAHQGHLGPVAQAQPAPGIQRAVRRGRRRHLLRRQAVQPDPRSAAPRAQGAGPSSSRPARRRRSCGSTSRTSAPSGW